MNHSVRYFATLVTVVGMGFFAVDASAASLRSPRHGQATVDVSGGTNAEQSAPRRMMPPRGTMPNSGNMEMMQNCSDKMRRGEGIPQPGKVGMGHRSNMSTQKHLCMANVHSSTGSRTN